MPPQNKWPSTHKLKDSVKKWGEVIFRGWLGSSCVTCVVWNVGGIIYVGNWSFKCKFPLQQLFSGKIKIIFIQTIWGPYYKWHLHRSFFIRLSKRKIDCKCIKICLLNSIQQAKIKRPRQFIWMGMPNSEYSINMCQNQSNFLSIQKLLF